MRISRYLLETPCETPFPLDNWLSNQRLAGCLKGFDYLPGDLPSEVLLAGSEGGAGFLINSEEWLRKPGSVGKKPELLGSKILDEAGAEKEALLEAS